MELTITDLDQFAHIVVISVLVLCFCLGWVAGSLR